MVELRRAASSCLQRRARPLAVGPASCFPLAVVASSPRPSETGSSREAPREQKRSVEHAEHIGDLRRFRVGILITIPAWCAYGGLDYVSAMWGAGGTQMLLWLWTIRWGALPAVAFVLWGAFKTPAAGPRLLRVLDFVVYNVGAWGIALMAVRYGGIASSYLSGIMMAIVGRGAFSAQPWKRALLPNVVMASSFPVVMGVASFFVPAIRAQLSDPAALSDAAHYLSFNYGTMVLMIAATHYAWTLRRQLFETRSIGRYRLKGRIAAGGMGEVWAAYHPGLKRDIALKILRVDEGNDGTAIARFEREVKATSDLSHPNTIRVFDFGTTDDGIFYYAMELLEGVTLAQLVRAEGPLPPARAVHLVTQAARSLAEAHDRGIVHRDVKPANIFVTNAGGEADFVKVLDFGIAKRFARTTAGPPGTAEQDGEAPDLELTGTGVLAGTPKYMAPEIVLGREVTPHADVYGLGAVLYFLLAGRAPFDGATAMAIYASHVADDVPSPSSVRGEALPEPLERIVARCLAKEPSERFVDAGELAHALEDLGLRWRTQPKRSTSVEPPPTDVPAHAAGSDASDAPTMIRPLDE